LNFFVTAVEISYPRLIPRAAQKPFSVAKRACWKVMGLRSVVSSAKLWRDEGVGVRNWVSTFQPAALAQKYRCPLLTGDPEFRSIPDLELDWIGRPII